MTRWEYKFIGSLDEDRANDLGRDGWELVHIDTRGFDLIGYFKREIRETSDGN